MATRNRIGEPLVVYFDRDLKNFVERLAVAGSKKGKWNILRRTGEALPAVVGRLLGSHARAGR